MSKLFSFYQWINSRIGFKLLALIFAVAIIFIPITSFISYQYTYGEVQQLAQERVQRLVSMIRYNASMAAYLSDIDLASDITASLVGNPEIKGVRFSVDEDTLVISGEISRDKSDIEEVLTPPFGGAKLGTLEVFLNRAYIHQQARDKGISLVIWQSFLVVTILLCVFVIFRQLVSRPLNQLLEQIRHAPVDGPLSANVIQVSSSDEIGFLAQNTHSLMNRISNFYRSEAAKNKQILKLERQFRIIFEHSHAGIALIDDSNQVYLANPSFKAIFQYGEPHMNEVALLDLFDDKKEFESLLKDVREESPSAFRDFRLNRKEDVWLRVICSRVDHEQKQSLQRFVELVVYDISDRAHKEKAFVYNATHDALTGIYNRRGGDVRFRELCLSAEESGAHLVMIWLDLNDFKVVNDEHGHEAGDIVLKELSSRLRSILRPNDIIARWGGDEFVVAITLEDISVLPSILSDIESAFTECIEINDDFFVSVGASIGVSTSLNIGYDVEQLLIRADQMMYRVKREGKNGTIVDDLSL
ncbi:sensor domain-containing diguanylate cyclase [uncultured Vibrio sp.]|uniref:sensor domain-containing diguanylate cyclase n=1 Tax=uncultured Vibrio sp. TaxID=114054 RepID=UPI002AA75147|nr:sensor domain-containing diguanylate cyclase [uncultured Vibrio sp.]